MSEKILYKSSDIVVTLTEDDDKIELVQTDYPLAGYANRVETGITLYKKIKRIVAWQSNYDWNGTGSRVLADVAIGSSVFNSIIEKVRNIKTHHDVADVVKEIEEYEGYIDDRWDKAVDELVRSVMEMDEVKTKLDLLKDKEEVEKLKEEIKGFIDDYVGGE